MVTTRDAAGRHFRVVVNDLGETPTGAFTFTQASAAAHSAARWISVSPRGFTATGRPQPVDYAISVPANATPGAHVAAISVQELPASTAGNIGVVEAIGLRETVRISGPTHAAVKITRLSAPRVIFGGPVGVSAMVTNVGNTVLDFDGANAGSVLTVGTQSAGLTGVLLPGATRAIAMTWTNPPLLDTGRAELLIRLGHGRSVSLSRETLVLPPWRLLGLLLVALTLVASWVWRRRRTRVQASVPASA